MAPKFIAFMVFLYVIGSILGLMMEDQTLGVTQQSTLDHLMVWQNLSSDETWGLFQIIGAIPDFFDALWHAAIWDFAFLTGPAIYIKWFIWAPLMSMFVWGVMLTFVGIFQKALT